MGGGHYPIHDATGIGTGLLRIVVGGSLREASDQRPETPRSWERQKYS